MGSTIKTIIGSLALAVSLGVAAQTPTNRYNLPAQPLSESLKAVAAITNFNVLFDSDEIATQLAPPLQGTVTVDQALATLLVGSGLKPRYLDEKTVVLERAKDRVKTSSHEPVGGAGEIHLARADGSGSDESSAADPQKKSDDDRAVEEIVVTAQKREERLQDVPVPVTVVSGETLIDRHQIRFQEYFSNFPNLNFGSGNRGDSFPAIRGLTTGTYTNPTVGTVLDDIPYGASIGSVPAPDIDPSDLDRIEVLRGPQGTLYGASSLGGLIKYVTADPSMKSRSGRVEVGTVSVHNGSELGYTARASVNVPLSDTFAIRASGFTRTDPGYIDNPNRRIDGVNEGHASGGHLAALWKPSDDFSLKLSALLQRSDADGNSYVFVNPGYADLQQSYLPNATGYDRRDETFGATIRAKLGSVDLVSISSYSNYDHVADADLSVFFGPTVQRIFGVGGSYFDDTLTVSKYAEEIRVSSSIGSRIDWLIGGFYTRESLGHFTNYWAVDNASLARFYFGSLDSPLKYREYAGFADVTFHLTDRLQVQVGGRQSYIDQPKSVQRYTGQYAAANFGADPFVRFVPAADASPVTYLLTPQFKFSDDMMGYLRFASGFQPGGINIGVGVPPTYDPNTTQNYEIGLKGTVLERTLSFDVSLYRIDWNDLPTVAFNPSTGATFRVNGGEARSQGMEVSVEARPLSGLTVAGWIAWGNATLTKAVSPGRTGDRLPYSSRFSSNFSIDQRFPITTAVSGFAGVVWSYMGDRQGNLAAQREFFPAYSKVDLRLGVDYESWTVNAFVNNVADKRGAIGGGLDAAFSPFPLLYIQPRTIGLSLARTFR